MENALHETPNGPDACKNNKKGKPKMKKYVEIAVVAIMAVVVGKKIPVVKDYLA